MTIDLGRVWVMWYRGPWLRRGCSWVPRLMECHQTRWDGTRNNRALVWGRLWVEWRGRWNAGYDEVK